MDKHKATALEKFLVDEALDGYQIQRLINFGKSAAVFEGVEESGSKVAIKVFDADLIDKYGDQSQQRRITQEMALKEHDIPGLVRILGGGKATIKDQDQHFLIMEFIVGQNLKEYISTEKYDELFIRSVLIRLFEVSEALLKRGIAHRDIKPENIMVSASGEIILMDLGVIKLIGTPSETDVTEPQFLGTLRYAPPEYLTRKEEDTPQGWKAVNLYQIGATLHDLIMKKEMFHDRSPYANIVIAVKEDAPVLEQGSLSFDLVQLAKDMLMKNPKQRLNNCSDDRIRRTMHPERVSPSNLGVQFEKFKELTSPYTTQLRAIEDIRRDVQQQRLKRKNTLDLLTNAVTSSLEVLKQKQVFRNYLNSQDFQVQFKRGSADVIEANRLIKIEANISKGLPFPLLLIIHEEADANDYVKLEVAGFVGTISTAPNINNPAEVLSQLPQVSQRGIQNSHVVSELPKLKEMFAGILQTSADIEPLLVGKFLSLILTVITALKPITEQELAWQVNIAKGLTISRTIPQVNQFFFFE